MASKSPIRVAVTGAAGNIGYAAIFRLASGAVFGPDQPVALNLIEVGPGLNALAGVVMELQDCAFPLLTDVVATGDLNEGFKDADWCLLIGAVPRKDGMERKDLLEEFRANDDPIEDSTVETAIMLLTAMQEDGSDVSS